MQNKGSDELIRYLSEPGLSEDIQRFQKDCEWLEGHRTELTARYPDRWVAVFHKEVIGTQKGASSLQILIKRLREQGYDTGKVVVRFLATKPKPLILVAAWREKWKKFGPT
jgi:hypothetical protein